MLDRRRLLIALGLGTVASPTRLFAQAQAKVWRIGFLTSLPRPATLDIGVSGAFRNGMRGLGYVEGRNVSYEWRFTDGKLESLGELAAELVRLKVDLIVTGGTPSTRAAQKITKTTPIVMVFVGDPIGNGLIASLARPGGNITGVSNLNVELNPKRVELLVTTLPGLSRIAALLNPASPTYAANLSQMQAGASRAKVTLLPVDARTPDDIERAFFTMKQQKAQALMVQSDTMFVTQARQIGELATKSRLPAIGPREIVDYGGLMSYLPDREDAFQLAANHVDRILKGARPADLPVEQPTKIELVINLKSAKALGISLPQELRMRADEVIQ
jgi:putative ABC transport system substrate-binding protein